MLWILLLCALGAAPSPTRPDPSPFSEPLALFAQLDVAGYREHAAGVLLQALLQHPDDPEAPRVRLHLSARQIAWGHHLAAQATLDEGSRRYPSWRPWFELATLDLFLQAHAWDDLSAAAEALPDDPRTRDPARVYRAWAEIAAQRPEAARAELAGVQGPLAPLARDLDHALADWDRQHHPNPNAAAALSLLPGAGQVYAGDPALGLGLAALHGGLVAGGLTLYRRDQPVLAAGVGVLLLSSWMSTATDAWRRTKHRNRVTATRRFRRYQALGWVEVRPRPGSPPLEVVASSETGSPLTTAPTSPRPAPAGHAPQRPTPGLPDR